MFRVDAALGGVYEEIGKLITATGQMDSSGFRRIIVQKLLTEDYEYVIDQLKITEARAKALAAKL